MSNEQQKPEPREIKVTIVKSKDGHLIHKVDTGPGLSIEAAKRLKIMLECAGDTFHIVRAMEEWDELAKRDPLRASLQLIPIMDRAIGVMKHARGECGCSKHEGAKQ